MNRFLLVQRYIARAFLLGPPHLAALDSPRDLFADDHLLTVVTLDTVGPRTIPACFAITVRRRF
jgi:hypothetical protein